MVHTCTYTCTYEYARPYTCVLCEFVHVCVHVYVIEYEYSESIAIRVLSMDTLSLLLAEVHVLQY